VSVVYLYAISGAVEAPVAGEGLQARPLRSVAAAGLAAVVSDHDGDRPAATEAQLWAHERVVEELMADRTLLPMRFGSLLADDRAAQAFLRARRDELQRGLRHVAGAIELGVRVAWSDAGGQPDDPGFTAGSGAAYLMGMLDCRRRARDLADRVDASLAGLARARRSRVLARPNLPFSGAYLVDRECQEAFRERVRALGAEVEDAEIVCTGPWPPYGFTAVETAAA
jgi:hypothetical protein